MDRRQTGMQIRSRVGNWLLIGFGALLLTTGVLAVAVETRQTGRFDPGALIFVALLSLPGLWCIVGGVHNLRHTRAAERPRRSVLARLVQADAIAIAVSAGTALLCLGPEWKAHLPRFVGAISIYALWLSLLAVPVLAVAALANKAVASRRRGPGDDAGVRAGTL